jgi:eukaryotic-like serine/threonine-protein kinase
MSFLAELKRRRVIRVALVYAATAFVILQAADLLSAGLALPSWIFAAITLVTILGFPLALVLAWAFQITPEGVQRTGEAGGESERWLSRRSLAVVGVALLLILAGGWFINPVISSRLARSALDAPLRGPVIASLVPPPGETWQDGSNRFAVSPDGRTVAIVGFEGGGVRLSLRALDGFDTRTLPATLGAAFPFWSPDGRSIGFFADGELRVVAVASGQVRTLCPTPIAGGGSWGAGDVILYTAGAEAGLHRTDAAGGTCEPVRLRNAAPPLVGRPHFLGDGRHYVFSTGPETWLGRIGGDSLTRLELASAANTRAVVAAPDYLLFRGEDGGLYAQRIDLRRRRMSGTSRRLFDSVTSPGGHTAASASANGVMVLQGPGSTAYRVLQWTDRAGAVLDSLLVPDHFWMARLSALGDRVALGGWQIGLHDRARGVTTVLLSAPPGRPGALVAPVWAPGDTLIAFRIANDDSAGIRLLDPRTGATRAIDLPVELRRARPGPVDWSRDGRLLAFILPPLGERTRSEAWVYDFVTGEASRLFEDRSYVADFRFSPDGRWVAWLSVSQGNADVYVRPLHGESAPLRVSPDGGARPRWSADGRELYFLKPPALMVVSVRPDATTLLSAPRLFRMVPSARAEPLIDYEPTADGGLAFFRNGGDQPGYTLVLNWTRLLGREDTR